MKFLIGVLMTLTLSQAAMAATELEVKANLQTTATENIRTIDRYSYNFGRVWTNSSTYISYGLTNTGTTNLTFDQATIRGAGFSGTHTCTAVLAPMQRCSFTIRFSPFLKVYTAVDLFSLLLKTLILLLIFGENLFVTSSV
jgi:hypothetical protein